MSTHRAIGAAEMFHPSRRRPLRGKVSIAWDAEDPLNIRFTLYIETVGGTKFLYANMCRARILTEWQTEVAQSPSERAHLFVTSVGQARIRIESVSAWFETDLLRHVLDAAEQEVESGGPTEEAIVEAALLEELERNLS